MSALDYFLKANLYGLLFVGCYYALLRRHTFFGLNRAYLLVSVILSLALPLISLPAPTVEALPVPVGVITLPVATVAPAPVDTGPDWERLGWLVYGFIAGVLLLRLALRIRNLLRLIRQSPRQAGDGYVLVRPDGATTPTFSFFRYVVLNPADADNALILSHERVHVRQGHSADVLALAVVRALFWPCLALMLIDRALRQVHEFLADRAASGRAASNHVATPPTEYAHFLVEYAFGVRPDALTNGFFNPSLLKQRIQMLHQSATNRWALSKYVLILPLALGLLAMTTARETLTDAVNENVADSLTVTGRVTGANGRPLAGAMVVVANTGQGTPTDAGGRYTLTNVSTDHQLAFSYVGYRMNVLKLAALKHEAKNGRLTLNPMLQPTREELPEMGATAAYKAIKPNPAMPVRTPLPSETTNGAASTAVEEPAVFPTGIPGLMQYVAHSLRYPTKARANRVQGNVFVNFTILPTGAVGNVKVMQGIGSGCDEEAARIVRQMPNWIPGRQNGKPVAVRYMLPVLFTLDQDDKRTGQLDPPVFGPTQSPIGDFPTMRSNTYPNQPRLMAETVNLNFRRPALPGEEPLYILDSTQVSGDIVKTLNPKQIESMTVLKDASARAQYGERGKNGVVIITTVKP